MGYISPYRRVDIFKDFDEIMKDANRLVKEGKVTVNKQGDVVDKYEVRKLLKKLEEKDNWTKDEIKLLILNIMIGEE